MAYGLRSTAGAITGAALIMVVVGLGNGISSGDAHRHAPDKCPQWRGSHKTARSPIDEPVGTSGVVTAMEGQS